MKKLRGRGRGHWKAPSKINRLVCLLMRFSSGPNEMKFYPIWSSDELNIKTKINLLVSCVFSSVLGYVYATYTVKAADVRIA